MKLRPYWSEKSRQFSVRGYHDKILTEDGIRYILFFDIDEKYIDEWDLANKVGFPFRLFKTLNGYHAVGFGIHPMSHKKLWFDNWKKIFPKSDFRFENQALRPHSYDELQFTTSQFFSGNVLTSPLIFDFYRDKRVFELWEMRK